MVLIYCGSARDGLYLNQIPKAFVSFVAFVFVSSPHLPRESAVSASAVIRQVRQSGSTVAPSDS